MSTVIEKNSAAERREARRRRILENADNRLKKISDFPPVDDINGKFVFNDKEYTPSPDPEDVGPIFHIADACQVPNEQPIPFSPEQWNPLSSLYPEPTVQGSIGSRIACSKPIHLVVIALLTYFLLHNSMGHLVYESVMVPFYTIELAQLVLRRRAPKSGIASLLITVLGMYGVSSKLLSAAAEVVTVALSLSQDLFLYLFVIVLCNTLLGQ